MTSPIRIYLYNIHNGLFWLVCLEQHKMTIEYRIIARI